jgi:copper chaperone
METLKFKTTIKCSGCVAQATPFLDEAAGKENWQVDVKNPEKILTVSISDRNNEQKIIKAVEDAGYKAQRLG